MSTITINDPLNSIVNLRKGLCRNAEGLINGTVDPGQAKELSNHAGKIINTIRVQLEYAAMRNKKTIDIVDYMEDVKS